MHTHFAAAPSTKFMHFCLGLYFPVSLARLAWLGFGAGGDFIRRRTRWPDSRALLYAWASAPRIIFQSAALVELDRSGAPLTVERICDGQRDRRVRQFVKWIDSQVSRHRVRFFFVFSTLFSLGRRLRYSTSSISAYHCRVPNVEFDY